jgi:hypothetical protein
VASDPLPHLRGLCLGGDPARPEAKRLRYCLLPTAGILVRYARRATLRIADGRPWAEELMAAFDGLPGPRATPMSGQATESNRREARPHPTDIDTAHQRAYRKAQAINRYPGIRCR